MINLLSFNFSASIFESELKKYSEIIQKLEIESKELKLKLSKAEVAINGLKKIFTDGQIRKLMSPGDIQWEDISNAICLHAAGPRAYNHLYKKGYPLPHPTTLQRWCRRIDMNEGILKTAIDFMRRATDLEADDKIAVLSFDEMKVLETYEYDAVNDVVREPAKYVQVVMARGLRKSWKQPVFYGFDCQMTPELMNKIIMEMHNAEFTVVAAVSDLGTSNSKFWKYVGVTTGKLNIKHHIVHIRFLKFLSIENMYISENIGKYFHFRIFITNGLT